MCVYLLLEMGLLCLWVGVALSLAPPILAFSRGAGHASCREMSPGHISAHPLEPQHSYVTLRTSASSYLPGQLITGLSVYLLCYNNNSININMN